ncbi:Putative leucine-rich repeat receptor-like protein kinase [Morus notabilis]|uniref:Putative leucine-rich repeat receptor-like protein kinase n=1 Tax=Morus notabilis TaxID=981085 RepID=W9R6Q4_9ROSA|nr:Putative leucine-rich repeat receptor-like protein kinase [Morus notabilis]
MVISKHFLVSILQVTLVVLPFLIQAQDSSGFISIDCGISDVSSYTDETTGITYFSDANFTETGENRGISPAYKEQNNQQQLWNLRSFPEGSRNCYTLKPLAEENGTRYLVRAGFLYGNYDNKGRLVLEFDLYIGVELWATVVIEDSETPINKEITYVPSSDRIHICLVNTGNGIPFISLLELRPLQDDIYASESGTSLELSGRYDVSSETDETMRYKDDMYSRVWSPLVWKPVITTSSSNENSISNNSYQIPFTVMNTAYTGNKTTRYLYINWKKLNSSATYFFYMHFAELEKLQANQSREFNIYINGAVWYGPFVPRYLSAFTIYSDPGSKTDSEGTFNIWLNSTDDSTLPPLINALEMYVLREFSQQTTSQADAEAISDVKLVYGLKRNWQGDPCAPETYLWDGLNCSYNANSPHRIVSLNLSSSGLKGEVAPSIASLKMLKILNLKGNNFTGPVPDALTKRAENGLLLSIDTSPSSTPCTSGSCGKKKTNFVVPLVASLGGVLFLILTLLAVLWALNRKKQQKTKDSRVDTVNVESNEEYFPSFVSKKQELTYPEIQRITNNFERVLGEGGFGKLKLLLRVHHKNLTTLIGYCNEASNIALVYEYMAMGNLRSHLSGSSKNILSWEDRLRIAIDTAQGLEYLHNGCKPQIVHRDVKSTNILLNERMQAKLGDFGLAKFFPTEGGNYIASGATSTPVGITASIAGTPGYIDPEYYISNSLNEKSDVYSFGVMLLEIITARPVLAKTQQNNHVIEWVSSMLGKGDIKNILDPRLEGDFSINSAWKLIEISMACVSRTSTSRPTMSRVTIELKECLATELSGKDGHSVAEYSKDSVEMVANNFLSLSPRAR